MKLVLSYFIAAIMLVHILLDKFYLGPEVGQFITVIEAHSQFLKKEAKYLNLTPIGEAYCNI